MDKFRLKALVNTSTNIDQGQTLSANQPERPKGNRQQRRKQEAFSRRLNRRISKMQELGPVNVRMLPDGGVHVTLSKSKAAGAPEGPGEEMPDMEALLHGPGVPGLGPAPMTDAERDEE